MKRAQDISLDAGNSNSTAYRQILSLSPSFRRPNCNISSQFILRILLVAGALLAFPFSASISEVQTSIESPYSPPLTPTFSPQSPFPDPFHGMDQLSRQQFQRQLKELNIQRQKQLSSDSEKLLALATELKTEVGQARESDPTPEQLRKAEQIEKLAHSVRDKMKDENTPGEPMVPMRRK